MGSPAPFDSLLYKPISRFFFSPQNQIATKQIQLMVAKLPAAIKSHKITVINNSKKQSMNLTSFQFNSTLNLLLELPEMYLNLTTKIFGEFHAEESRIQGKCHAEKK